MIVSGKISVKAIVKERKREIKAVYILDKHHDKESRYVEAIAKGLKVERMDREAMDQLAGNKSHGGYLVECERRLSDSIDSLKNRKQLNLMCVEGVSDPFNLGEIMRTAQAMGFDGMVTPDYDFYEHEAKLIRASAGASEMMWWNQSSNIVETLKYFQDNDVEIVVTHRGDDSVSLHDFKAPKKAVYCFGGALRGLSRSILDLRDVSVRIDYDARVSLSTVGATSVIAYEVFRQQGGK